ncbi:hypothetical protein PoB_003100800 [Plakobranchus ocellatus]|uniref:Uncharacterized protein n=1 Tax=Plakobranchus ocellatus TaxID=259542 RepID=A0AAV4ACK4_9GAST|nr:hypothetical protein PoB_003100800 [Plakobranchus ocellatus]
MAAEMSLLPHPRGKKPRKILRLPVPRKQQKSKYQPSAELKSRKDRRLLGKHSIVLRLWRWMMRILYPQSGGIPPPSAPRGPQPSLWRHSLILEGGFEVPIPKPGKDPSDPSNYRPIALTSCLFKTHERMVND